MDSFAEKGGTAVRDALFARIIWWRRNMLRAWMDKTSLLGGWRIRGRRPVWQGDGITTCCGGQNVDSAIGKVSGNVYPPGSANRRRGYRQAGSLRRVCLKEGTDLPMQAGADAPWPQKRPGGSTPGPVMLCEPISWTTTLPAARGRWGIGSDTHKTERGLARLNVGGPGAMGGPVPTVK